MTHLRTLRVVDLDPISIKSRCRHVFRFGGVGDPALPLNFSANPPTIINKNPGMQAQLNRRVWAKKTPYYTHTNDHIWISSIEICIRPCAPLCTCGIIYHFPFTCCMFVVRNNPALQSSVLQKMEVVVRQFCCLLFCIKGCCALRPLGQSRVFGRTPPQQKNS